MTWRDISTAPKDDTVLVVMEATDENVLRQHYHEPQVHPAYIDPDGVVCCAGSWRPDPGVAAGKWRVTHWQPLPPPPGSSTPDEAQRSEPARSELQHDHFVDLTEKVPAPSLSVGEEKLREALLDAALNLDACAVAIKKGGKSNGRHLLAEGWAERARSALSTDVGDGRLCTAERATAEAVPQAVAPSAGEER